MKIDHYPFFQAPGQMCISKIVLVSVFGLLMLLTLVQMIVVAQYIFRRFFNRKNVEWSLRKSSFLMRMFLWSYNKLCIVTVDVLYCNYHVLCNNALIISMPNIMHSAVSNRIPSQTIPVAASYQRTLSIFRYGYSMHNLCFSCKTEGLSYHHRILSMFQLHYILFVGSAFIGYGCVSRLS